MQEFDHIEALWAKHTVDVKISADDMLKQAKKDVGNIKPKSLQLQAFIRRVQLFR